MISQSITYIKLTRWTYPVSKRIWKRLRQILKHLLPLDSGNLQLEQTIFFVFSLYFGKISRLGFFWGSFPVFPVQWVPCFGEDMLLLGLSTVSRMTLTRVLLHVLQAYLQPIITRVTSNEPKRLGVTPLNMDPYFDIFVGHWGQSFISLFMLLGLLISNNNYSQIKYLLTRFKAGAKD